jgi:hypothetical protein
MALISRFETQIEILGDTLSTTATVDTEAAGAGTPVPKYWVTIDWGQYDGVTGWFFESSSNVSVAGTATSSLYDVTGTAAIVTSSTVTSTAVTPAKTRSRSASLAVLTSGVKKYAVYWHSNSASVTASITNAHIIIQQDATATKRAVPILMSSSDQTTATTAALSGFSDNWKFNGSNWDGITGAFIEYAGYQSAAGTGTITLRDVTAASNAGTVTTTSTVSTSTRSATDIKANIITGHEYAIWQSTSIATSATGHGNAYLVIIQQNYSKTEQQYIANDGQLTGPTLSGGSALVQFDPTQYGNYDMRYYLQGYFKSSIANGTDKLSTDGTNAITNGTLTTSSATLVVVEGAETPAPTAPIVLTHILAANTQVSNVIRFVVKFVAIAGLSSGGAG